MIHSSFTDFVLVAVILLSNKYKVNPDNLATPLAASIGDVVSITMLSFITTMLFTNLGELRSACGVTFETNCDVFLSISNTSVDDLCHNRNILFFVAVLDSLSITQSVYTISIKEWLGAGAIGLVHQRVSFEVHILLLFPHKTIFFLQNGRTRPGASCRRVLRLRCLPAHHQRHRRQPRVGSGQQDLDNAPSELAARNPAAARKDLRVAVARAHIRNALRENSSDPDSDVNSRSGAIHIRCWLHSPAKLNHWCSIRLFLLDC